MSDDDSFEEEEYEYQYTNNRGDDECPFSKQARMKQEREAHRDGDEDRMNDPGDYSETDEAIRNLKVVTEWQEQLKSVTARDKYVLFNNLWVDCSFLVGKEEKEFECHRLQLAKISPVFAKMLYRDSKKIMKVKKRWQIPLRDMSPNIFQAILDYAYGSNETKLPRLNKKELAVFFDVGVKYQLPIRLLQKVRMITKPIEDCCAGKKPRQICFCWAYQDYRVDSHGKPRKPGLKWQHRRKYKSSRDVYILENQLWTDCEFAVGQQREMFHCHRLMLAKTSPVFARMLCDRAWKNELTVIPDISSAAFAQLIRYCYVGAINERRVSKLWEILIAAKKYFFPLSLLEQIRSNIWSYMWPHRVWQVLYLAQSVVGHYEEELAEAAWNVVRWKPNNCFQLKDFKDLPEATMIELVKQKRLNCEEEHLFDACLSWGRHQAMKHGISETVDPKAVRSAMANLLPWIRFFDFDAGDGAMRSVLKESMIFSKYEMALMIKGAKYPNLRSFIKLKWLCHISETRCYDEDLHSELSSFYCFGTPPSSFPLHTKTLIHKDRQGWKTFKHTFVTSTFTLYCSSMHRFNSFPYRDKGDTTRPVLFGVQIATQKQHPDSMTGFYDEDLSVFVIDCHTKDVLIEERFQSRVRYHDILTVEFSRPRALYRKEHDVMVQIYFHKSGRYPRCGSKVSKRRLVNGSRGIEFGPEVEIHNHAEYYRSKDTVLNSIIYRRYEKEEMNGAWLPNPP